MADEIVVRVAKDYGEADLDSPRYYTISVDKFLSTGLPVVGTVLRFGSVDDTEDHVLLKTQNVQWVIDGTQKLLCDCAITKIRLDDVIATDDELGPDGERLIDVVDEIDLFDDLAFAGADPYEPPPPEEP